MTFCPTCSNPLANNANSCPRCGHVVHQSGGVNLRDPVHLVGVVACVLFLLGFVVSTGVCG